MAAPKHAEMLSASGFIKLEERTSKFAPPAMALVPHLVCVACHEKHDVPKPDQVVACQCGLRMLYDVAHVYIWRDEPAEVA